MGGSCAHKLRRMGRFLQKDYSRAPENQSGWWFYINIFHPYLGKIPNLTNIFQRGWFNHHPVSLPDFLGDKPFVFESF